MPTPSPSARSQARLARRRSLQELVLAVLAAVLFAFSMQPIVRHGWGPLVSEPAHVFERNGPDSGHLSCDVLGAARLQTVHFQRAAGSHWNSTLYEIQDRDTSIFKVCLMTHNGAPRIWFSGNQKPLRIIVWQPWCQHESDEMDHPIGYWRYDYDGHSYVRRPLFNQPLLMWAENAIGGLDL